MSLTSFLRSPDVRERFWAEITMPPLDRARELLAPPLSRDYGLVGTAFDYPYKLMGEVDAADLQDLHRLITLVDAEKFRARKFCALSPTFGNASELIGGEDCDSRHR